MLHTKFCVNRPASSGEEDCSVGFYHSWAWRPSWSCDPNFAITLLFPLPMDAPHNHRLSSLPEIADPQSESGLARDGER